MQHFESAKHGEMRVATRTMRRSVDSPECECMQHFESAKHGEMRVATRTMRRSVDSPECECMQHFESAEHGEMRVATRSATCCDNILEIKESIYGGK